MFNIIPQPVTMKIYEDKKGCCIDHASITDISVARELVGFVKKIYGKDIVVSDSGKESIVLKTDDNYGSEEGYTHRNPPLLRRDSAQE